MIKYLGSKRLLIPKNLEIMRLFPELESVGDVFSGTSRVGHACKKAGFRVWATDMNAYAHCLAKCYVAADREKIIDEASALIEECNRLHGEGGWFTQTYCVDARYFQPHNGVRIELIRNFIEERNLEEPLRSVLLTSLIEAADRVDSTCGIQMAYLKDWSARSNNVLKMRMPDVVMSVEHGQCAATRFDANDIAGRMDVDIMYIDPPYNQHSYLGNYHVWESLVLWDNPEVYGVAKKRVDVKTRKSTYNRKHECKHAFRDLISKVCSPLIIVSFN